MFISSAFLILQGGFEIIAVAVYLAFMLHTEQACPQNAQHFDIVLLVDASSSMAAFGSATFDGVREFLYEQKRTRGATDFLEVRKFSRDATKLLSGTIDSISSEDIERCIGEIIPSGPTRLIETALEAVIDQHSRRGEAAEGDYRGCLCAILTDGKDTCGGIPHFAKLQSRVALYTAGGGQFLWLQANLDAIEESQQVGGQLHQALQIGRTPLEMLGALRSLTSATTRYCSTGLRTTSTMSEWGDIQSVDDDAMPTSHLQFTPLERMASCRASTSSGVDCNYSIGEEYSPSFGNLPASVHLRRCKTTSGSTTTDSTPSETTSFSTGSRRW